MIDIRAIVVDPTAQAAAVAKTSVVPDWPEDVDDRLVDLVDALDSVRALRVFDTTFTPMGYASYVEVKMTRSDDSLVVVRGWGVKTSGFGLLLCSLAPIAAFQAEAQVSRSPNGSGTYSLPGPEAVCDVPVPGFPESAGVLDVLARHGYTAVGPDLLLRPIADGLRPETNLNFPTGEFTVFDAWFHWED